jgi:hypothetical protein
VNVDELKQDFEKRIFVYKVAILVFIVGMGWLLLLFLIYILWSIFWIEKDIRQTLILHWLDIKKVFVYVFAYSSVLMSIWFLIAIIIFNFLYYWLGWSIEVMLKNYGIDFKIVGIEKIYYIYFYLILTLIIFILNGLLVKFKKWRI